MEQVKKPYLALFGVILAVGLTKSAVEKMLILLFG